MNKLISIILICSLLLACLSGCSPANDPDVGKESTPMNNGGNDGATPIVVNGVLDKSSDLIVTLVAYLMQLMIDYDMGDTSLEKQINDIKSGTQPLHVAFDPSDYYFVCGYYNSPSENGDPLYEYCNEYTWVGYENESDICEYYKDMKWAVVFQINRALSITDLLPGERKVPNMEHFQFYEPTFENGRNTNASITFDDTFIYLNYPNCYLNKFSKITSTMYYSNSIYYHYLNTISCICLDDQYYIDKELYRIYPDGTRSDSNVIGDFGEYYDSLAIVMDTQKHKVIFEEGPTVFYGLIKINDFKTVLTK
jgi:hypothetical protein